MAKRVILNFPKKLLDFAMAKDSTVKNPVAEMSDCVNSTANIINSRRNFNAQILGINS